MDVQKLRNDFPILRDGKYVYFDNAATAQRPVQVEDAMRRFTETTNANPLRGLYEWSVGATEQYENARRTVAKFIGAADECEVIFTRNTTESLNLVAYSYGRTFIRRGDEIAVSILEHHSNLLPWQMVARETGAALRFLECDSDGTISDAEIESKITAKTKLVACNQVSNVLGVKNPIRAIADRAHAVGAVLVVDGAQSAPHMAVDVAALGADFFAFSGHKLMGPMGIGVLWGKKELLDKMPPFLTGGEMIESVTRESATYAPLPAKFEAGTVNAAGAVGLAAAIEYLQGVGFENVAAQELKLTQQLLDAMRAIPHIQLLGADDAARRNGIVSFNIEGCHPHDVATMLDSEHICIRAGHHCAQPLLAHLGVSSSVRASLYFYNTEEEVARFAAALGRVRGWMGYKD
jgi:cysteine desulfurase/selenocysteine lyase